MNQVNSLEPREFQTLKTFFETRLAAQQAMRLLPHKAEISIVIGESVHCALFAEEDGPKVENRLAKEPLFNVFLRPETVELINATTKDDPLDIAFQIGKEVLSGDIKFDVGTTIVLKIMSMIRQMRR